MPGCCGEDTWPQWKQTREMQTLPAVRRVGVEFWAAGVRLGRWQAVVVVVAVVVQDTVMSWRGPAGAHQHHELE